MLSAIGPRSLHKNFFQRAIVSARPLNAECFLAQRRDENCAVGAQRRFSSKVNDGDKSMKYVYVHPLSQIVLECLQSNYSEWLVHRQLHSNSLSLHRDGTFEIKSSSQPESRIWTSFDDSDKKHWLSVKRGTLYGRYMLQDNLLSAWNGNRKGSLPERIHGAVREMIEEIESFERKSRGRW